MTVAIAAPERRMSLASIRHGRTEAPLRVLLYGPEGIGKTTFGASAPAPIFLGTEGGFGLLDVPRFPAPENWRDVGDALRTLTEAHEYKTLVLDSADWLEPLCWAEVCKLAAKRSIEEIGFGKGYVEALGLWRSMLSQLERLTERGMNVVILAHGRISRFNNPEGADYDRWTLKVHEKAAGLLKEWCDCVLFANYGGVLVDKKDGADKGKAVGKPTRVVYTTRGNAFDAKNRYALPEQLPLDWYALEDAVRKADPAPVVAEIEQLITRAPADIAAKSRDYLGRNRANLTNLSALLNKLRTVVPAPVPVTELPST
jgi:hypothetical protein